MASRGGRLWWRDAVAADVGSTLWRGIGDTERTHEEQRRGEHGGTAELVAPDNVAV
jgi:hypothetical protein